MSVCVCDVCVNFPVVTAPLALGLLYGHTNAPANARTHPHNYTRTHTQVWSNLLQAARIEHLDVAELGKHELNGRQIKTTIRLAQALALHEGCSVEQRHVSSTLAVARQFSDDLISAQDFV